MIAMRGGSIPRVAAALGVTEPICSSSRGLPNAEVLWIGSPDDPYRFRLLSDFSMVARGRRIDIAAGFVFDAASVPGPLRSVISPLGLGTVSVLVHDKLYELGDTSGFTRIESDWLFLRHMRLEGVGRWPRYPAYAGVRLFGEPHWRST